MKYVRALKKKYDEVIKCCSHGNCIVVKNGKYGLVDSYTGKELIAVKYDEMREIDSSSAFVVKVGEHYGIVNEKGTVLVPTTYDQIDEHRCAGVLQKNGQYAFYHLGDHALKKTTRITPLKYDTATPFSYEGFSVVSVAGKYGFVDSELEEWIAPYYDTATPFQVVYSRVNYHYLSIVSVNGQYGIINERNEIIVPMEYDDLAFMNVRNKVLAKSQGKYGILDYVKRKIKAITPFQYDAITAFDDDMAGVCIRQQNTLGKAQWGFIDATGQEVIAPQFDQIIYPFLKGRAYVEQNGERFFIDKAGQKITRDIPNTLSAKVNVLDENVGKLSEYLRNHADVPQLNHSSLTVFYWQTPYDLTLLDNVPDDYPYTEEFAQYNRLREKMRLERVDDLDDLLRNQLHYPVLSVGFFSALPFNQGATNVCFFIIRENNQVYLTWTYSFLPQTYVELLTQSQPFDLDALSESEIALLDNLLAHIEMACNDWEIATEKNQGIFVRHKFDEQADVNRLIELLDDNIGLTKQAKTRLKKGYFELNDQPEKFRKKLEKWLDYDKDELADVDKAYLLHLLLTDSITHYADDWKFDTEALSAFIANQVGQAFEITLADYQQGLSHINHNLEQQCAYSILNINSFGDNYHLMLVRTSDKAEFVTLSERLNLSIHDF